MNLVTKAIITATRLPLIGARITKWVQNRFDAAFQGWGERSWLFQALQDAWLEIDAMTRQELQRISDSLIENSPIVDKIVDLKVQFSVGSAGLKIIPESSDEGFNDARSISWEQWWNRPMLGTTTSGAMETRIWARLLPTKGEIFVNLTQEDVAAPGLKKVKAPRLQTIDCHRVKNPGGMAKDQPTGFPLIDGEVVHPLTGATIAWYVRKVDYTGLNAGGGQTGNETFDRIPAYDPATPEAGGIIHKFHKLRPGQRRGIPEGTSVFNLVRDNMDLHKLTMQCAKINAEIAQVETNPSGELDALLNRKSKLQLSTQNAAGASTTKTGWADYNVSVGGKKIALKTGSKISDFVTQMPSPAQQDYWDLHYTMICIGYKVPKMLVMPYSLQGTVTRADLDICTAAFRVNFEIIRELCETIYAWQGTWDIKANVKFTGAMWQAKVDRLASSCFTALLPPTEATVRAGADYEKSLRIDTLQLKCNADHSPWVQDAKTPDDSHICLIRPPRAPNVDIGYTAKALEIELNLGMRVPQDIFADKGQDWRTQTRQKAEYIAYVKQLALEFKIDAAQITTLAGIEAPQDPKSVAPAKGEDENAEAKLKTEVTY